MRTRQFVFQATAKHSGNGLWTEPLILKKEGNWWTIELNLPD